MKLYSYLIQHNATHGWLYYDKLTSEICWANDPNDAVPFFTLEAAREANLGLKNTSIVEIQPVPIHPSLEGLPQGLSKTGSGFIEWVGNIVGLNRRLNQIVNIFRRVLDTSKVHGRLFDNHKEQIDKLRSMQKELIRLDADNRKRIAALETLLCKHLETHLEK